MDDAKQFANEWEADYAAWGDAGFSDKERVAVEALYELTDDQRVGLSRMFCGECGRIRRPNERMCQCWNDE